MKTFRPKWSYFDKMPDCLFVCLFRAANETAHDALCANEAKRARRQESTSSAHENAVTEHKQMSEQLPHQY
jgi:hypothetical protein